MAELPGRLSRGTVARISVIARMIEMPIRYSGPGQWSIFSRPQACSEILKTAVAVPGIEPNDR